ncbi:MAG: protein arginine kinase [Gemmatimonadota bacterium]
MSGNGTGTLDGQGLAWLEEEGADCEIVLSTRVRLARNLQGFPFSIRAGGEERRQILDRSRSALAESLVLSDPFVWEMASLDASERTLLLERHLVSRELIGPPNGESPPSAALALSRRRALGVMINEEDHLRLQALRNGLQLDRAWKEVEQLDEEIGGRLPYAFHHEFGFLTSCPTNVGTGLRASVLVHLAGLVLTKEIGKVLQGISQIGLTFRGLYGEGSEVVGNFFQISNQTTLGKAEDDLIEHLEKIVHQVLQYEREARAVLIREAPSVLEDKVWRAYGILRHARSLGFDEMMNLLSGVRLGLTLKLLRTPRVQTLNRVMIYAQTAHLGRSAGRRLDESDADVFRASFVREALAADEETAA